MELDSETSTKKTENWNLTRNKNYYHYQRFNFDIWSYYGDRLGSTIHLRFRGNITCVVESNTA